MLHHFLRVEDFSTLRESFQFLFKLIFESKGLLGAHGVIQAIPIRQHRPYFLRDLHEPHRVVVADVDLDFIGLLVLIPALRDLAVPGGLIVAKGLEASQPVIFPFLFHASHRDLPAPPGEFVGSCYISTIDGDGVDVFAEGTTKVFGVGVVFGVFDQSAACFELLVSKIMLCMDMA